MKENIVIILITLTICTVIVGSAMYNDSHYNQVCTERNSPLVEKFHEVESTNIVGATRNNYYVYLKDGKRLSVTMDQFVTWKVGDNISYENCERVKIK